MLIIENNIYISDNFIYEFLRSLFAGIEDKGWCREAERGRDRSQVTLRRRDNREEGQQQAERTPGGAPAARESNYTDTGPAPIAATESLQWSRFVKHSHEEILSLIFASSFFQDDLERILCNETPSSISISRQSSWKILITRHFLVR